jgi:hypothetical protein
LVILGDPDPEYWQVFNIYFYFWWFDWLGPRRADQLSHMMSSESLPSFVSNLVRMLSNWITWFPYDFQVRISTGQEGFSLSQVAHFWHSYGNINFLYVLNWYDCVTYIFSKDYIPPPHPNIDLCCFAKSKLTSFASLNSPSSMCPTVHTPIWL